jgi:hypothetical protein
MLEHRGFVQILIDAVGYFYTISSG